MGGLEGAHQGRLHMGIRGVSPREVAYGGLEGSHQGRLHMGRGGSPREVAYG